MRRVLIGVAFACGAAEHAAGFVLHQFGIDFYAHYPPWRHPTLAVVDALIAWIAFRRPRLLFPAVLGFLIEQIATNGLAALSVWRETGRVEWFVVFMHGIILLAVVVAWSVRPAKAE